MAAVDTTAPNATATSVFNGRHVDRNQDGTLWTAYKGTGPSFANTILLSYSKDGGATWSARQTATPSSSVALSQGGLAIFIDQDDYLHMAWRQSPGNGSLADNSLLYARATPNAGRTAWTWSAAVALDTNIGRDFPDITACRNPVTGGWDAFAVWSNSDGNANNAFYSRVPITSAGAIGTTSADGLPSGASPSGAFGRLGGSYAASAHTYPSVDFNHTGDGKTVAGGTPHLYVGWTAGATGAGKGMRFRKAVYSAGAWTWNAEREIDPDWHSDSSGFGGAGYFWHVCMFDGTRVIIPAITRNADSGGNQWTLYERDAADTATTKRLFYGPVGNSLFVASDALVFGSAAYNQSGDVYFFGRDNTGSSGTRKINRRVWTRSTATLGPIVTIDATGNDAPYLSARRGTQGSAVDVVWTDGTASPYTVQHDRLVLNVAPTAPTLLAPIGGGSIDRTATQRFSWTFNDPDAGDTQSAYSLRYRATGSPTWTVLTGITPSTFRDVAAGTFADATAYEWQVATTDAAGVTGPFSGSEFFTAATPPPGPTITAPVNGGTISTTTAPLTWSYPTQQAYQVRVLDAADAVLTDTGTVSGTAGTTTRTVQLEFPTNNVTRKLQVRVQDSGTGLWSPYSTVTVTVSYTPPAVPTLLVVPSSSTGSIGVLVTHPTPTGSQPAVAATEVEVRADTAGDPYRPVGVPVRVALNATAFDDRAVASGVEYSFRAKAVGANQTSSYSAWTT